MLSFPRSTPAPASDAHDGAGSAVSRRTLAKGAAWAAPVIAVSTLAPAIAASPCAAYRGGQTLPASAFTVTYLYVTRESLGGVASKQVYLNFGFKTSAEARACGVTSGSLYSNNAENKSRVSLTNGKSYNLSNGGNVPANGSAGTVDTFCDAGLNGTEACGTTGLSRYNVDGSAGTSSYSVNRISLYRRVTLDGFSPTIIYLNATIAADGKGSNFSVTSAPLF